ncbi:hypothetical protein LC612_30460 [Nostoc sp. CHAB 5834]|nr:hypothetical protein [Nostoc sp. CHAB 5834]
MKFPLIALLGLLTITSSMAETQNPPGSSQGEFTLQSRLPPQPSATGHSNVTIHTDISAPRAVPASAEAATGETPVNNEPIGGLPSIAAAGPASTAAEGSKPLVPTSQAPDALVEGQPVKVYSTLGEAAQDGLDPFKPQEVAAKPSAEPPMEPASKASAVFNWKDPQDYVNWAKQNPLIAAAVGALLAVFVLLRIVR